MILVLRTIMLFYLYWPFLLNSLDVFIFIFPIALPLPQKTYDCPRASGVLIILMDVGKIIRYLSRVKQNKVRDIYLFWDVLKLTQLKKCWVFFKQNYISYAKSYLFTTHHYVEYHDDVIKSNGNIFRVTGYLCGEFTDHRWIPRTKASDAELWCFLWSAHEWTIEKTIVRLVIWDAIVLIMTSL